VKSSYKTRWGSDRKRNSMKNGPGSAKEYRRKRAIERQKIAADRTPEEQLHILDKRLGKDVGAVRERTFLLAQIKGDENE